MKNEKETQRVTQDNIEAWNEVAPKHAKSNQEKLIKSFSDPNFLFMDETERRILNDIDVAGKDVAQICCNNGREIISVKRLGAGRCVGFDGSQAFVDQANELAKAASADVEFVCANIYNLGDEYTEAFDLLTITIGVLGWMPDIDAFFAVLAPMVKPGGKIFIYEQHPILNMIEPGDEDAPIVWELSYFDKEPYVEHSGLDYYEGESYASKPVTSYSQTMAEILTAGLKQKLTIEHIEEYPHHISNTWWNVENSDIGLPMCFTLIFGK